MNVSREDVLRIAQLAELHVEEEALGALAAQMSRILGYVAQIGAVPGSEQVPPFVPGPERAALRPDVVRPDRLAFGPAQMAQGFRDGFFTVPRLGAFDSGEAEEES